MVRVWKSVEKMLSFAEKSNPFRSVIGKLEYLRSINRYNRTSHYSIVLRVLKSVHLCANTRLFDRSTTSSKTPSSTSPSFSTLPCCYYPLYMFFDLNNCSTTSYNSRIKNATSWRMYRNDFSHLEIHFLYITTARKCYFLWYRK